MENKNFEITQFDNLSPKHEGKRTEKTLKFKNLTEKQKKLLQSGGVALGAASLGALAVLLMGATTAEGGNVVPNKHSGNANADIKVFTDAPFASSINDNMSFLDAFKAARAEVGPGGFFEWHGQTYNTYTKDEWDSMSDSQKHDFYESVDHDHHNNHDINEEEVLNALNDHEDINIPNDIDSTDKEDIVIIEEDDDDKESEDVVIIEEDDDDDMADNLDSDLDDDDDDDFA